MKHFMTHPEYEQAFACFPRLKTIKLEEDGSFTPIYEAGKCPHRDGPTGCPRWVEIQGVNAQGDLDTKVGCDSVVTNHANVVVLKSNGRIVASLDKTATVLHTGFNRVYEAIKGPKLLPRIKEALRLT